MLNIYKSNDEWLQYNYLKVHPNFFNLVDSKTIQYICGKQVKLDKIYCVKNLETYASRSDCSFQNGTNKGQPSILNFVKKMLFGIWWKYTYSKIICFMSKS